MMVSACTVRNRPKAGIVNKHSICKCNSPSFITSYQILDSVLPKLIQKTIKVESVKWEMALWDSYYSVRSQTSDTIFYSSIIVILCRQTNRDLLFGKRLVMPCKQLNEWWFKFSILVNCDCLYGFSFDRYTPVTAVTALIGPRTILVQISLYPASLEYKVLCGG